MGTVTLDSVLLGKMLKNGCLTIKLNAETVNSLNVFPVPDGDTGANMFATADGGTAVSPEKYDSVGEYLKDFARETLYSARGNSGVILSQFISGIATGANGFYTLNTEMFKKALKCGVEKAYASVITPVEGTVLTVMREASEKVADLSFDSFESMFDFLLREMKDTLARTPDMLKVLKEAGVVDSGGAGLIYFFEGMYNALLGKMLDESSINVDLTKGSYDIEKIYKKRTPGSFLNNDGSFSYGYCTEFILELMDSKICQQKTPFDMNSLVRFLNENGSSVVSVKEGNTVKVHVHTFTPGEILSYAQQFGEFYSVKIENMALQEQESSVPASAPEQKYAIVAVASGDGLIEYLKEVGVDFVIGGGQTDNPSVNDFISAYEFVNAENIIVLPDNGNIIMAAKKSGEMYKKSNIFVLPTHSVAEGLAAVSMFDSSKDNIDDILSDMSFAASNVTTGLVTYSVRDCVINGMDVKKDDYIGLDSDKLLSTGKNRNDTAFDLIKQLNGDDSKQVITLIYGNDVTEDEASLLEAKINESFPFVETGKIAGGQAVYSYIISLE